MPLIIIRQDITRMRVQAIVNAANSSLMGGGGVDGAIHKAAGPKLAEECRSLNGCRTGEAKITHGYDLPAEYVIHTVGPVWEGGGKNEAELLRACYINSLELAAKYGLETIAFPVISSGIYRFPADQAFNIAQETITEFLKDHEMTVYIVVFGKNVYTTVSDRYSDIEEFIDDRYVAEREEGEEARRYRLMRNGPLPDAASAAGEAVYYNACDEAMPLSQKSLEEALGDIDESFTQMLLRKIDEAGMTDVACYKRANIDRKLFSKIRSNMNYKPSKTTALAFAVALRLDIDETEELLRKAGYAISHSNKGDIIVEYFILKGIYDINEINRVLFSFDQAILGSL